MSFLMLIQEELPGAGFMTAFKHLFEEGLHSVFGEACRRMAEEEGCQPCF